MSEQRERFLRHVKDYITNDPEAAAFVADSVRDGLRIALSEANHRAKTMETIAISLASRRYKGSDKLIAEKLRSMKGKTDFNWDWFTGGECHDRRP